MGKITILSKSSNNSYSYVDSDDAKLAVNGNFEMNEQEKKVLSANGNITYDGMYIANFSTSMYNDVLQYSVYGAMAEDTEKAFKALSGVQEQLKAQVEGTTVTPTPSDNGAGTAVADSGVVADDGVTTKTTPQDTDSRSTLKSSSSEATTVGGSDQGELPASDKADATGDEEASEASMSAKNK